MHNIARAYELHPHMPHGVLCTTERKQKEVVMQKEIDIKRDRDHFVVYINGNFYCTADSYDEAIEEVKNYEKIWEGNQL